MIPDLSKIDMLANPYRLANPQGHSSDLPSTLVGP